MILYYKNGAKGLMATWHRVIVKDMSRCNKTVFNCDELIPDGTLLCGEDHTPWYEVCGVSKHTTYVNDIESTYWEHIIFVLPTPKNILAEPSKEEIASSIQSDMQSKLELSDKEAKEIASKLISSVGSDKAELPKSYTIGLDVGTGDKAVEHRIELTDAKITNRAKGEIELSFDFKELSDEEANNLKERLSKRLDNPKGHIPEIFAEGLPIVSAIYEPFKDSHETEIPKEFYIPKSVYTNIVDGNYKEQKNLQLKTIEGVSNLNTYYKVKLVAEIPADEINISAKKLYDELKSNGIRTEVAVETVKSIYNIKDESWPAQN